MENPGGKGTTHRQVEPLLCKIHHVNAQLSWEWVHPGRAGSAPRLQSGLARPRLRAQLVSLSPPRPAGG